MIHYRRASFLVKPQPLIRRQATIASFGIMAVHLAEHLQHIAAFAREVLHHIDKLPASMRQAVGQEGLGLGPDSRDVAR